MNTVQINHSLYMDDLKLYAKNATIMNELMTCAEAKMNEIGLKINTKK